MIGSAPDVIDLLAGIETGSRLDRIRAHRPAARINAQKSYLALFAPALPGDVSINERYALATFVAGLHQEAAILAFYRDGLLDVRADIVASVEAEIANGAAQGPFGHYPKGPLSAEDKPGPTYRAAEENRHLLGRRLPAAFEHAHLLVFRPRDASPAALRALLDAGWSTSGIVTLSQVISFLTFQIRVIVGLRALGASPAGKE
jgi:CMD domain protein